MAAAPGRDDHRRDRVVDAALLAFCTLMLLGMVLDAGQETIPYHLLFLSFTITYGFRIWPLLPTLLALGGITGLTGWIMYAHFLDGAIDEPELAEVPLMPALVLAMVWHARRRAQAQWSMQRMADERRAILERERDLLRDTSHAIRTPVTIARGHLELAAQVAAVEVVREDVEIALRQLARMSKLSDRLLTLAQLDSGVIPTPQPIRLTSFLDELAGNWCSTVDRRWTVSCRADAELLADQELLALAVDALVENAVHFTAPDGAIALTGTVTAHACTIRVEDDGPGIDPSDLEQVFTRFWHRRPPNGPMGSGLGLAMATATARASGGRVRGGNRPEGGAVFEITLPRLTDR